MSIVNLREKTINAKIVYYGTALGGKTTSLKHVHRVIDPEQKVELVSLNTESDRTLFFDFLPITLGVISGFTVRLQGFTVPGQVKYNLTRKYVLTGADAVVFVVDSARDQFENNEYALANLAENLSANGMDPESVPLVLQYNKRDLDDLVPVEELDRRLNVRGVPAFETVATEGTGVFETFVEISRRMVAHIASQYRVPVDEGTIARALEQNLSRYLARGGEGDRSRIPDLSRPQRPATSSEQRLPRGKSGQVQIPGSDPGTTAKPEDLLKRAVNSNIEIAQLYSEVNEVKNRLHDRVRELTTLNEVGKTLASELDVDRLAQAVLDSASFCLETEHASLLLLDEQGMGLLEHLVSGFQKDPLARAVTEAGEAKKLLDRAVREDGLWVASEGPHTLLAAVRRWEPSVVSFTVAPLVCRERRLGAIVVYFVSDVGDTGGETRKFLSALASHAAVALENAGLVQRIEGFNRELEQTVLQRTAELRKAYDELRELDRLKDDFLSSISHELLTPLTSIQSFSEILISMDDSGQNTSLPEFLGIINQESLRLTRKLEQLLQLSQIEAGKISFRDDEVNLRRVVEQEMAERSAAFSERSLRTSVRCPPRPVMAVGDEKWICRAVGNLLDNAAQFTQDGGQVDVELDVQDGFSIVAVCDDGVGVPAELHSAIFRRFKQIGEVLTDKPKGVGLGLPLAREIVEGHGGRIGVESRPGEGSRFTIALPRIRRAARSPRPRSRAGA